MNKEINLAKKLWQDLYQDGGQFTDWSSEMTQEASEFSSSVLEDFIRENFGLDKKTSTEIFKQYYGISNTASEEFDQGYQLFKSSLKYYGEKDNQKLSKVFCGLIPRKILTDPLTGEQESVRLANAFVTPAGNDYYLIGITTQFSKLINDWSVISNSTLPNSEDKTQFLIPITNIAPAFASLVVSRWIKQSVPPTSEMYYRPEDLFKHKVWLNMSMHCSQMLLFFFINHEVAHILLGHLEFSVKRKVILGNHPLSILDKQNENEISADIHAIRITLKYIRDLAQKMRVPDNSLETYSLIQLIKFFSFIEVLDKFSNTSINYHPPALERANHIISAISQDISKITLDVLKKTIVFGRNANISIVKYINKAIKNT